MRTSSPHEMFSLQGDHKPDHNRGTPTSGSRSSLSELEDRNPCDQRSNVVICDTTRAAVSVITPISSDTQQNDREKHPSKETLCNSRFSITNNSMGHGPEIETSYVDVKRESGNGKSGGNNRFSGNFQRSQPQHGNLEHHMELQVENKYIHSLDNKNRFYGGYFHSESESRRSTSRAKRIDLLEPRPQTGKGNETYVPYSDEEVQQLQGRLAQLMECLNTKEEDKVLEFAGSRINTINEILTVDTADPSDRQIDNQASGDESDPLTKSQAQLGRTATSAAKSIGDNTHQTDDHDTDTVDTGGTSSLLSEVKGSSVESKEDPSPKNDRIGTTHLPERHTRTRFSPHPKLKAQQETNKTLEVLKRLPIARRSSTSSQGSPTNVSPTKRQIPPLRQQSKNGSSSPSNNTSPTRMYEYQKNKCLPSPERRMGGVGPYNQVPFEQWSRDVKLREVETKYRYNAERGVNPLSPLYKTVETHNKR